MLGKREEEEKEGEEGGQYRWYRYRYGSTITIGTAPH